MMVFEQAFRNSKQEVYNGRNCIAIQTNWTGYAIQPYHCIFDL